MSRLTGARALALCIALLCVACGDLPGQVVGTYELSMRLGDNTCGALAVPMADGKSYALELRADGQRGYWRQPQVPPIEGQYDGDGGFTFKNQRLFDLGDPDAGTAGCRLYGDVLLTAHVVLSHDAGWASDAGLPSGPSDGGGADAQVAPLSGQSIYTYRTDPSGTCANNPGPLGVYQRLPCSITYSFSGTTHKPF